MRSCRYCGGPIPKSKRSVAIYCSRDHATKANNSNAPVRIITRAKSRAKKLGIPFNLEPNEVIIPEVCPVLGIPLVTYQGKRGYHPNSASLDRIDPNGGYCRGNVRVISARANLLKNNATLAELRAVLADLENLHAGA